MKKVLFVMAALAAIPALSPTPAAAVERRFCLQQSDREGGVPLQCYYDTYAQCHATASGSGGTCSENPIYSAQNYPQYGDQYQQRPRQRSYRPY